MDTIQQASGKMAKDIITVIVLTTFAVFIGAVLHERDMESNCKKYGNAKAWFTDIKCSEMKK